MTSRLNIAATIIACLGTIIGAAVAATMMIKDVDKIAAINKTKVEAVETTLVKIESKLDQLVDGQSSLNSSVSELRVDMNHVKESLKNGRNN